jgi:hypothetical protein
MAKWITGTEHLPLPCRRISAFSMHPTTRTARTIPAIIVCLLYDILVILLINHQRRWNSTTVQPPPPGGHLPGIATSQLLRTSRNTALHTPGIKWADEDPPSSLVGGRETRKMNTYQAVRDAMR